MNDAEILNKVQDFRRDGETGNQDLFKRMRRCKRFKVGQQWDSDVKEYYKSKRRHALTINRILPTVLQMCGVEIQNKKDIKARNIKGGSATVAKIFTALVKHAMDNSNADYQKSQMFDDGLTNAAGYIYAERDYTDDPKNGNLVIRKLNSFNVIPDPNIQEYDPNISGKFIIFDEWVDKDKIKKEYKNKEVELGDISYSRADQRTAFRSVLHFLFSSWTDGYDTVEGEPQAALKKYRYRVSHTFWKEYRDCAYMYKTDSPEIEPLMLVDKKQIRFAKKIAKRLPHLVTVVESTTAVLHHTKSIGDVLLEDIENPFPNVNDPNRGVTLFPIVPYYPYYYDGYAFGIVENLIGPQEEHNWARSQTLNLIKLLANTGWVGRRFSPKYKEFIKEHAGEDGIILEEDKAGGKLEKIKPNDLPTSHVFIAERSSQDIQEIANVRLEQPQWDEKQMSGKAIALKQQASLTGSAVLFSNYDYTMRIFATLLVEIIRNCDIYSEQEIRAIVDEADLIDQDLLSQSAEILKSQGIEMPPPPQDIMEVLQQAQIDPNVMGTLTTGDTVLRTKVYGEGQVWNQDRPVAGSSYYEDSQLPRSSRTQ